MTLPALIDKLDTFEIVRDQIGAILLAEVANQKALAAAAAKDTRLWDLRIYSERSNPWADFVDPEVDQIDLTPIVHVAFDRADADAKASTTVERQKLAGTYHVDCYGCGLSASEGAGHVAGDEKARLEAQRAARLVRNILMAGENTYLGLRGTVAKRWVATMEAFQPAIDDRAITHVAVMRLTFNVDFIETSPQVTGEALELISSGVKRAETGQLYFTADYDHTAP